MNNYSYLGAQFDDSTNRGIDPQILLIDQAQRASRLHQEQRVPSHRDPSVYSFKNNIQGQFPPSPAASQWQQSLPNRPATPIRGNAFGITYTRDRPVLPDTPPSTIRSFPSAQHPRLRELQSDSRGRGPLTYSQEAYMRPWQDGNPFALLDPDGEQSAAFDGLGDSSGTNNGNQVALASPINLADHHGLFPTFDNSISPGLSHQQARNPHGLSPEFSSTLVSTENVSMIPANPRSHESMDWWTQGTYQVMPNPPSRHIAPPTPTPSGRHRRRASRASSTGSVSTSSPMLSCDKCCKLFEKRHKLNHHYRWHEDPTHTCEECGKKFVAKKDLRRHQKIHKKEERHLFCNIMGCKYEHVGFQRKDHLKRHLEKKHGGGLLSPSIISSPAGG